MADVFTDLIKGKSVAIVGPALYMKNLECGSEIESHDIVVRINRSIETTQFYENNVGKRTDILYSCLIEKAANAGKLNVDELKNDFGVQLICAPPKSSMEGISYETAFHDMVNIENVKKIMRHIPIRIVDHGFHTELAKNVMCRPNTGFLAIYDLLRCMPKKLSIYGFSFYLDGFLPGCKSGIEEDINLTEQQFVDKCFNSKRHNQKNMWQFAKSTLPKNSVVIPDPVLERILKLESLSKELFAEEYEDFCSN